MYHNLGIQDIFTMCFGLAELWKMLLKSLSVLFLGYYNRSTCLHRELRCLSVRVPHLQKCLEAAFRKCASVDVASMYTARARFRDTGLCQGTDCQLSLHVCPWTLILQERNQHIFIFLPCHFRWPCGSWPNIHASLTCKTRSTFIIENASFCPAPLMM